MKIELKQAGKLRGDCTAPYDVIISSNSPITVNDLIIHIIENRKHEWGYIGIINDNEPFFGEPCIEYKHGKLLSEFDENILNNIVEKVKADGGYSRMDYQILLN